MYLGLGTLAQVPRAGGEDGQSWNPRLCGYLGLGTAAWQNQVSYCQSTYWKHSPPLILHLTTLTNTQSPHSRHTVATGKDQRSAQILLN